MAHLIYDRPDILLPWAAKQIPYTGSVEAFGKAVAVGVTTGPAKTDRLMAVVVFYTYDDDAKTCQVSAAAVDPRWASRGTLRGVLAVPFIQYGCNLVWSATPHTADRTIRFIQAVGFTREAVLKSRFGPGLHAVLCRIEARDYEKRYLGRAQTQLDIARADYQAKAA